MRASVQSSCSVTSRKRGLSLSLKGEYREPPKKQPSLPKNTIPNVIYQKLPPAKVKFIGKPQMRPQIYTPISNSPRRSVVIPNNRRVPIEYPQRQFSFTQGAVKPNNNLADYERRKAQELLRQNLKNELQMLNCSLKQKERVLAQRQRRSVSKQAPKQIPKEDSFNLTTPYNKINFQPELTKTQNINLSEYPSPPKNAALNPSKLLNNYISQQSMTISIHKPNTSPKKLQPAPFEVKQFLKIKEEDEIKQFQQKNKPQKQNIGKIVINESSIKEMKRKEKELQSFRKSFDLRVFEQLENKLDRLIGMTSN